MYDNNLPRYGGTFLEVFTDDFLVFGESFYIWLTNLEGVFVRCEEANIVLN